MRELTEQHIALLRKLAVTYHQKQKELEKAAAEMQPLEFLQQAKLLGGLTLDRFRSSQQALIVAVTGDASSSGGEALQAATTLCQCFDEMQILFQTLLEKSFQEREQSRSSQT